MADIKVQRNVDDIGVAGGTNTGFDSVSALTAAFEFNNNNQWCTAGDSGSGSNLEIDDISGRLELTGTGTMTFSRVSGSKSANMRFAWELIEYIGAASGDNEFIVRSRNTVTLNGVASTTASLDTSPTNADKCIPFITGVTSSVTRNGEDHATCAAYINDSGDLAVSRGGTTGTTIVQVVVVEFTGSNWEVYHGRVTGQSGDTGNIQLNTDSDGAGGSTGDVTDWSTAFIVGHLTVTSGHEGLAHQAVIYNEGQTTDSSDTEYVNWEFNSGHGGTGDEHVVHVLRHADMTVTRFSNTANAANASNIDITSASLTDISQAMVIGKCTTSGTGDALGRGWRNYRLTSTTNVEHWCHRSGNTMRHEIQVVDFTGVAAAVETDVPVSKQNLTVTQNSSELSTSSAFSVNKQALSFTINSASAQISQDAQPSVNSQSLELLTSAVQISAGNTLDANKQDLSVDINPIALSAGASIAISKQDLILAPKPATTSAGSALTANKQDLALTLYSATAQTADVVSVPVNKIDLLLAAKSAQAQTGSMVAVSKQDISFSINAASVQTSAGASVAVNVQDLILAQLAAGVSLDTTASVSKQNIAVNVSGADVSISAEIAAAAQSLSMQLLGASVSTATGAAVSVNNIKLNLNLFAATLQTDSMSTQALQSMLLSINSAAASSFDSDTHKVTAQFKGILPYMLIDGSGPNMINTAKKSSLAISSKTALIVSDSRQLKTNFRKGSI